MAPQTGQMNKQNTLLENKFLKDIVDGFTRTKAYADIGISGNPVREKNIQYYLNAGFEKSRLLTLVHTHLVLGHPNLGGNLLTFDTDLNDIDGMVDAIWAILFDTVLI